MKRFLFDKDYSWITNIAFVIVIVFLFVYFFSIRKDGSSTDECENEKRMSFKGVVTEIRFDSVNRAQSFIFLNDGQKTLPPYTCCLWNIVKVCDSIIKYR